MKKTFLILLIMILTVTLCSCEWWQGQKDDPKEDVEYLKQIIALQTQINNMEKMHNEFVSSSNVRLEELSLEIEAMKKNESEADSTDSVPENKVFLYELEGEVAAFTGYSGNESILVIPSHIDGYPVIKIGEKALSSSKLTTVIISEGVKKIDWFAFQNSPFLVNVTIPNSVTEIGYSAFDGCSSALTIYCEKDSYAHSYAQSFGIPYVLT